MAIERPYREHRAALLGVAYRMLGSFADAEDVVQEAFVRYAARPDRTEPDSERAYLTTITTRLAIDQLRSARVRRETYPGPWLPEPAVAGMTDLSDDAALADSLSTAFLVLLERATPEQRAALVLRDVFDLPYAEIAAVLDRSEAACRQLASRGRDWVRRPARFPSDAEHAEVLAARFFAAAREGDLPGLKTLLAEDVEFVGDGGDSGRGVARAVRGPDPVAVLVTGFARRMLTADLTLEPVSVGTQPGVLILDGDERVVGVWSLVVDGDLVVAVHGVVNPDKLGHLGLEVNRVRLRAGGARATS